MQTPIPIKPPEKDSFFKKWRKQIVISSITLTMSAITFGYFIYDKYFKSQHQKFEEENIRQGTVKFPTIPVSDTLKSSETRSIVNDKLFYVDTNTYHYPMIKGILIKNLEKMSDDQHIDLDFGNDNMVGITISQLHDITNIFNAFKDDACDPDPIGIIAKGDRLYFSCKFIDLITENEIGEMGFNHWKIYRDEYLDYHEGDDKFEVIDKAGNIVFSIANVSSSGRVIISVKGYFNNPRCVVILYGQSTGFYKSILKSDSNWLNKAKIEVRKIKSAFPNKNDKI